MDINSLVTHKHLKSLGIGVVSQKLKNAIRVRFGEYDMRKFKPSELQALDVSKCQIVVLSKFQNKMFSVVQEEKSAEHKYVIIGNQLKQFTDSGWRTIRTITEDDLGKYRIVLDSNT